MAFCYAFKRNKCDPSRKGFVREEGEWKHAAGSVPSDSSKFKMFKVEVKSEENAGLQRPDPPVSMRSFEDTSCSEYSEFSGSSAAGVQERSLKPSI